MAFASRTRGVFGGGATPTNKDTIDFVTIASTGNATDFGNLLLQLLLRYGGVSNSTRGIFAGRKWSWWLNNIEYVTIASTGNAIDFGDFKILRWKILYAGVHSPTRGIICWWKLSICF